MNAVPTQPRAGAQLYPSHGYKGGQAGSTLSLNIVPQLHDMALAPLHGAGTACDSHCPR